MFPLKVVGGSGRFFYNFLVLDLLPNHSTTWPTKILNVLGEKYELL